MSSSIVIQNVTEPAQLFLLFHGVGATPESLEHLGSVIAHAYTNCTIISVQAPNPSDFGHGFQWFPLRGVTEENRPERVQIAMPSFIETVKTWQQHYKVTAQQTVLIGFSQGAIMALSSTQFTDESLAKKIISLSGRFAQRPEQKPKETDIIFLHGEDDSVIDMKSSQAAYEALLELEANTQYRSFPNLGHSINQEEIEHLMAILQEN